MSSLDSEAALRELPDGSLTRKEVNELLDLLTAAEADVERLAHKAAQIGFTYGALGRDFEYAYKNVNDMLAEERVAPPGAQETLDAILSLDPERHDR